MVGKPASKIEENLIASISNYIRGSLIPVASVFGTRYTLILFYRAVAKIVAELVRETERQEQEARHADRHEPH
jgi:hypothetical protein